MMFSNSFVCVCVSMCALCTACARHLGGGGWTRMTTQIRGWPVSWSKLYTWFPSVVKEKVRRIKVSLRYKFMLILNKGSLFQNLKNAYVEYMTDWYAV